MILRGRGRSAVADAPSAPAPGRRSTPSAAAPQSPGLLSTTSRHHPRPALWKTRLAVAGTALRAATPRRPRAAGQPTDYYQSSSGWSSRSGSSSKPASSPRRTSFSRGQPTILPLQPIVFTLQALDLEPEGPTGIDDWRDQARKRPPCGRGRLGRLPSDSSWRSLKRRAFSRPPEVAASSNRRSSRQHLQPSQHSHWSELGEAPRRGPRAI